MLRGKGQWYSGHTIANPAGMAKRFYQFREKFMKTRLLLISMLLFGAISAYGADQAASQGTAQEVEAVMSQYYDNVATYQYEALRAMYTQDFEILDDGSRFDATGFEDLLKRLNGNGLTWDFTLSEFNTELAPTIGYTSYLISDVSGRRWYGSAVLERTGDGWRIDRMSMITKAEPQAESAE